MSTAFREDEDEEAPKERSQDRELTLSSTTLLVLFFGLVLLCGLFFGLGYTVGRRAPSGAAAQSSQPATLGLVEDFGKAKPSPGGSSGVHTAVPTDMAAAQQSSSVSALDPTASSANSESAPVKPDAETVEASSPATHAAGQAAAIPVPTLVAVPPAPSTVTAAAKKAETDTASVMVQVAAVSNQQDAEVLLSALRKHGYAVSARREPGDSLMHVQVGPFSNRADAQAMRLKLLNDGYNAILK